MAKPFRILRDKLSKRLAKKRRKVTAHINNVVGGLRKRGATKAQCAEARAALVKACSSTNLMCLYCFEALPPDKVSVDHDTPLSRGGGHDNSNLTLVCGRCNRRKGSLTSAEYCNLRAFLETAMPEEARKDIYRRLGMGGYGFRG